MIIAPNMKMSETLSLDICNWNVESLVTGNWDPHLILAVSLIALTLPAPALTTVAADCGGVRIPARVFTEGASAVGILAVALTWLPNETFVAVTYTAFEIAVPVAFLCICNVALEIVGVHSHYIFFSFSEDYWLFSNSYQITETSLKMQTLSPGLAQLHWQSIARLICRDPWRPTGYTSITGFQSFSFSGHSVACQSVPFISPNHYHILYFS